MAGLARAGAAAFALGVELLFAAWAGRAPFGTDGAAPCFVRLLFVPTAADRLSGEIALFLGGFPRTAAVFIAAAFALLPVLGVPADAAFLAVPRPTTFAAFSVAAFRDFSVAAGAAGRVFTLLPVLRFEAPDCEEAASLAPRSRETAEAFESGMARVAPLLALTAFPLAALPVATTTLFRPLALVERGVARPSDVRLGAAFRALGAAAAASAFLVAVGFCVALATCRLPGFPLPARGAICSLAGVFFGGASRTTALLLVTARGGCFASTGVLARLPAIPRVAAWFRALLAGTGASSRFTETFAVGSAAELSPFFGSCRGLGLVPETDFESADLVSAGLA